MTDVGHDGCSDATVPKQRLSPRALARYSQDAEEDVEESHDIDLDSLPANPSGSTGNTGNTSRTMLMGDAVQEARRSLEGSVDLPPGSYGEDDSALDEFDRVAASSVPRWVSRGAPALILLGVTVWSFFKLSEFNQLPEPTPPTIASTTNTSGSVDTTDSEEVLTRPGAAGEKTPEDPPDLLGLELELVRPNELPRFVKLSELTTRRITVVNAWATWCEPCKTELPALKAMFENADWGERVHFASVLTRDMTDPSEAYRLYAPSMPAKGTFLAELDGSGTFATALRRAGAITEQELPITVVLDCRGEVRHTRVGALEESDLNELEAQLKRLVGEFSAKTCPKPEPPTPPAANEPPPFLLSTQSPCGDGRCDPKEDCNRCPRDCGCTGQKQCGLREDKLSYACIPVVGGLK